MKKILLGTSALVGVAMLAGPAAAQIDVRVGGQVNFTHQFGDETQPNDATDVNDAETDAEIRVRASAKTDNGLTYGADIQIETGLGGADNRSNAGTDEAHMFIGGSFGRVQLGDTDGAADLAFFVPTVGLSQMDGAQNLRFDYTDYEAQDSGDDTKITYFTPEFSGFRAGISYVPYAGAEGSQGDNIINRRFTTVAAGNQQRAGIGANGTLSFTGADQGGTYRDMFEIGAIYTGEFSGVGLQFAGGIVTAESNAIEDTATRATESDDYTAWTISALAKYAGFAVGGIYTDNGDRVERGSSSMAGYADVRVWALGASYTFGSFGIAAQYADIDGDQNGGNADREIDQWSIGVSYLLAPGLTLGADYVTADQETETPGAAKVSNSSDAFLIGARLTF